MASALKVVVPLNRGVLNRQAEKPGNAQSSIPGYPADYCPRGLVDQHTQLQSLFRGLDSIDLDLMKSIENREVQLPDRAESWFVLPNWVMKPYFFGRAYPKSLKSVLGCLPNLQNYRENDTDSRHFKESARTVKCLELISKIQGNPDFILVPAQFGLLYQERSVEQVRDGFAEGEFGLGALAVAVMLLTHPERMAKHGDLWVSCPGDEYSRYGRGVFDSAPFFKYEQHKLKFGTYYIDGPSTWCGSVSAFVPKL
jgi:hypothetical protein